jgi:pimeloyl-ACP methyl ester carboxylesterase
MDLSLPVAADLAAAQPRRFRLPGGVELHGVQAGQGPRVVFIHGAMGDLRSWEPQWEAFTRRFTCVAYSRRYSFPNRNDMPSPDHSALHEAQDLLGLLDALGWDRAHLVGSSYGGFTALALAVQHPGRVQSVVAVEPPMMKFAEHTAAGRAARDDFRGRVIEPANAAFRAGDDELAARIMTGGINGSNSHAGTPGAMQRRLQNVRAMRMLALSSDKFPLLAPAALATLPMPVLLMSGADTPTVHREIFRNLCAVMPQARAVVVPGAGHGVSRDQAGSFNEVVGEFLSGQG